MLKHRKKMGRGRRKKESIEKCQSKTNSKNFCLLKMQFICAMQRIAAKATNNIQQNGSNSNSKHPQWAGKNEV